MAKVKEPPFKCDKTRVVDRLNWKGEKIGEKTQKCTVEAEDARDYIDIDTIISGCDAVAEYANSLYDIMDDIKWELDSITKDDLSVNGVGVDGLATDFQSDMNTRITTNIIENVNNVKETAIGGFNTKQTNLDGQAQRKCHIWKDA